MYNTLSFARALFDMSLTAASYKFLTVGTVFKKGAMLYSMLS